MSVLPAGLKIWGLVTKKRRGQRGVDIGMGIKTRRLHKADRLGSLEPGDPTPLRVSRSVKTGVDLTVLRSSDLENEEFNLVEVVRFRGRGRRRKTGESVIDGEHKVLPSWLRLREERNEEQLMTIDSGLNDQQGRTIVFSVGFLPAARQIMQLIQGKTKLMADRIVRGSQHQFVRAKSPIVVAGGSYLLHFVSIGSVSLGISGLRSANFVLANIYDQSDDSRLSTLIKAMTIIPLRADRTA